MKFLIIAFLPAFPFNLFAQSKVVGHYRNYFFSDIQLNVDSTFEYNFYHDLFGRWAKGTWTSKGDTVYFHIVPMYDTMSITKNDDITADTLILSKYSNPRHISAQQLAEVTVGSVEQNGTWLPGKVVFRENKLYEIKDGKLVTEKQIGFRKKEYDPWYFKIDE